MKNIVAVLSRRGSCDNRNSWQSNKDVGTRGREGWMLSDGHLVLSTSKVYRQLLPIEQGSRGRRKEKGKEGSLA